MALNEIFGVIALAFIGSALINHIMPEEVQKEIAKAHGTSVETLANVKWAHLTIASILTTLASVA